MKFKQLATSKGGQDGAIFGSLLFRFDHKGNGNVYDLNRIDRDADEPTELTPIASFTLARADEIVPHANAVTFGREYYDENDEFPLLYSNIYNNYAKEEDPLVGTCCVYRLTRTPEGFSAALVQLVSIGFTDDRTLWRSAGETNDVRPYGNFAVDAENATVYAFVMRDADRTTRYFAFDLPPVTAGECDPRFGVPHVRLGAEEIRDAFDAPYHNFIQGACVHDGLIYSVEGFDENVHPALRVIDPRAREEIFFVDLYDAGLPLEAECIDFLGDDCLYSDAHGNIFLLSPEL